MRPDFLTQIVVGVGSLSAAIMFDEILAIVVARVRRMRKSR